MVLHKEFSHRDVSQDQSTRKERNIAKADSCIAFFSPTMLHSLLLPSLLPFPTSFRLPHQLPVPMISNLHFPSPLLYSGDRIGNWESAHSVWFCEQVLCAGTRKKKKKSSVDVWVFCICWVDLAYTAFSRAERIRLYLHVWLLLQLRLSLTENTSLKKGIIKVFKIGQKPFTEILALTKYCLESS